ncbi:MAG TPA: hypothetical protein VGF44_01950 [Terriglobales bacterium]|jgi:hypothetical protein
MSEPETSLSVPLAQKSTMQRLVGSIVSPLGTFADIARKPTWIAPVLISLLLGLATTATFSHRVGWDTVINKQLEQSPRTASLPLEQRQQLAAKQVPIARVVGYAGAVIFPFLLVVVLALIFFLIFKVYGSVVTVEGVTYSASLGIISFGFMPQMIKGLIGVVLLLLRSPNSINIENLVPSNYGALVGDSAAKWMLALMTRLDIFNFWVIALIALGFWQISPKRFSYAASLAIIAGMYLAYTLVVVGFSAAFS